MQESKNQLSDEELMTLFQNGDIASFEILYHRYSSRVFAYLSKRVDSGVAPDLLQEIFFKLHNNRHQYSNQYPFLPWLFAMTRNAVVDFVRLKENKLREKSDVLPDLAVQEAANTWTGDLVLALESLPAQQKRAIELRYQSDWTFEQIASEMKTSPVNVRQIISRGIRKLRSKGGLSND